MILKLKPHQSEAINEGVVSTLTIRNLGPDEARCQVNIYGERRIAPGASVQLSIEKQMVEVTNTGKSDVEIVAT